MHLFFKGPSSSSGSNSTFKRSQQGDVVDVPPKKKNHLEHLKKSNLDNFVVKTSAEESQKFDIQIAKYFFASNTPFNHIEHREFKNLCELLHPGYNPPSRKKLSTTLLDDVFENTCNEFKTELIGKNVCMSLDGWSNIHREPVVCAVVTDVTTEKGYLIDTINTEDNKHDSEYLLQISVAAIKKCNDEFKCLVTSFVTDNAANMTKMRKSLAETEELQTHHNDVITYGCSSHIFNLLAQDVEIPGIANHIKQIVKYFRNTHIPAAKYRQAGGKMLVLPSEVRWNTIADTIEAYLDNWHILSKICTENRLTFDKNIIAKVENIQIKCNAQDYLAKLKVIAVALDKCQRNTCNIADATEIWKNVIQCFEKEAQPGGGWSDEKELQKVRTRYEMAITEAHLLANLLDPKYQGEQLTEEEVDKAMTYVTDFYPDIMPEVQAFQAKATPFKQYLFAKNTVINTTSLTWWIYCWS